MGKETFIVSILVLMLCLQSLQAQFSWQSIERELGLCEVDSLIISNPQYYSLLDTIEHHWSECEIDKKPCYAVIQFVDTNRLLVSVKQLVEIWGLATKCYLNMIYGAFYYQSHPYFFLSANKPLIDQDAIEKSTTFIPPFFSSQIYDSLRFVSDFLVRKENKEEFLSYPPSPFDHEWDGERYDDLELELILTDDKIVCRELEGCLKIVR